MKLADVMIVGSGHGGAQAAIALRQNGFEGTISMVCRDSELPYERPPLSKGYLARDKPFERILLRPAQLWADRRIKLLFKSEVTSINAAEHQVLPTGGDHLGYGKLIWEAEGEPRKLSCSGAELSGVHSVRSRADVDRLMAELDDGARKAVVVGGGYIGLEAAAVLRKLGCDVTLLEVLARVAGEQLSSFYQNEHRANGVDLRLETVVDCIEDDGTRITGVTLQDGSTVAADIVVVGIGIVPSVEPLIAAGAEGTSGVAVDQHCRTTLDDIYAIGDCAAHSSKWADGAVLRVDSAQNANDMPPAVAKTICGDEQECLGFPWFWSNHYDLKLQTAGLSLDHDSSVLRGDPAERKFSAIYLKEGRVIALDCVNAVKDFVQGRKLVEKRVSPDLCLLTDTAVPLREHLHT